MFSLCKFIPWARFDALAGLFWPTSHMFDTFLHLYFMKNKIKIIYQQSGVKTVTSLSLIYNLTTELKSKKPQKAHR